ncbi:hypothetical protein [Metamycoplasma neophronis]|uniref:Variable surface lipoprotein n=1 Tax=Metamycoplasma neophronis TaxID=872983 RepID=A0ABY2Z0V4_9BACT|nr:hypothetical protein [Metamycoplasma neophronis]TPR54046.1 hypothetical protein FJR74_01220 [Metamycoplasma neophronis]
MSKNKNLFIFMPLVSAPLAFSTLSCAYEKTNSDKENNGETLNDTSSTTISNFLNKIPNSSDKVNGLLDSSQLSSINETVNFSYKNDDPEVKIIANREFEALVRANYSSAEPNYKNDSFQYENILKTDVFKKYFNFSYPGNEKFGHPIYYFFVIKDSMPAVQVEIRCPDIIYNGVMALESLHTIKAD